MEYNENKLKYSVKGEKLTDYGTRIGYTEWKDTDYYKTVIETLKKDCIERTKKLRPIDNRFEILDI